MPFQKGQSGNPAGKPKGAQNKLTLALKDMILQALHNEGGVAYLQTQARRNPQAFLGLVGKVLPLQVGGPNGESIRKLVIEWQDSPSE